MKSTLIIFALMMLQLSPTIAGIKEAKYKMEIIPFKFSINGGLYRSRIANALPKKRSFNNPAFFVQAFFPFKRSIDHPHNFTSNDSTHIYYDRLFSATPYAVFHITEEGGNATGLGQELSLRIVKRVYAKIQIAVVWTDSKDYTNDGLKTGFNFHNYWYVSTFLSKRTALSVGFNHISNGRVFRAGDTSIFDMLTLGVSHSFAKRKKNDQ